ncbi:MAG TPA: hypothetical protein VNL17_14575 [Verrucomicrobiae bacterium]|nr:hypothetical protein [Verrucomicrobiae bacterium]
MTARYDPLLGYMPDIPCPWYCWTFWKWQKVRCACGKTFISRDLGLMPPEYETHYVLNHIPPKAPEKPEARS